MYDYFRSINKNGNEDDDHAQLNKNDSKLDHKLIIGILDCEIIGEVKTWNYTKYGYKKLAFQCQTDKMISIIVRQVACLQILGRLHIF